MQSSTRRRSIMSQTGRHDSAGSWGRVDSYSSLFDNLDDMSSAEFSRMVNQSMQLQEFPGDTSNLPEIPDYNVNLHLEPAALGGDADANAFSHGLAPTFKAAIPGAGAPTQQPWGGIDPSDDDVADHVIYPDPQDAHSQLQMPYHLSQHHQYLAYRPQQYAAATAQQSNRISDVVQNNHILAPHQEESFVLEPSQQRKRFRGASDADFEDVAIRHKKARNHPDDFEIVRYGSRSTSGTSISDVSDALERRMLKKSRQLKNRVSGGVEFLYEKPKLDDKKDWVRINNTTKGMTTRTAKINHYKAEYEEREHPVGDWAGTRFQHRYTKYGEWLNNRGGVMSAEKFREFILEYPTNKATGAKLKLWIQRGPTDCARRYKSATWAKCRFEECPAQRYQTGTILHGHYRVSFDEKWHRDRENVDPFLTAGYVHLYCMERFLDFPEICRKADVEVDTRQLTNEPRGKWAATLANQPECAIAQKFVSAASHRYDLYKLSEFANYPKHDTDKIIRNSETTYHKDTLTYHMHTRKETSRPPAQQAQFQKRGLSDTHISRHLGDLEKLFKANNNRKKNNRFAKKQKKRAAYMVDEEEEEEEPRVAPHSTHWPTPKAIREQEEEPDSGGDSEAEIDSKQESLFIRDIRNPKPMHLSHGLTVEQIKELYAKIIANEQAAQSSGTHQISDGNLLADNNTYLTEQNDRGDAIDPSLNKHSNVVTRSQTRLGSGIGSYNDPELDGFFDFDELQELDELHNANVEALQRHRSRVSMSKSIMKKPTSPGLSNHSLESSPRRVSIGKTTTREFFKMQSPHTVSSEGRRHSLRLQNKGGK
jgi:hypothetical protein